MYFKVLTYQGAASLTTWITWLKNDSSTRYYVVTNWLYSVCVKLKSFLGDLITTQNTHVLLLQRYLVRLLHSYKKLSVNTTEESHTIGLLSIQIVKCKMTIECRANICEYFVSIRLYLRSKFEVDASSIEHLEYWAGDDYYNRH